MTDRFAGVDVCSTLSGVLHLRSAKREPARAFAFLSEEGTESGALTSRELDRIALERAGRAEPTSGGGTRLVGSGRPAAGTRAPFDLEARL